MAQQFLNQLFQLENTVQIDELEGPTCMICLEPYGTFNPSTGATELRVRLPCGHFVGSVCIATWLRDKNSCHCCRKTFFPAQPRPYLEHGIMNDNPRPNTRRMGSWNERDPVEVCSWLCEQLRLPNQVRQLAEDITEPLTEKIQGQVHIPVCIAVVSVYIAWHLLGPDDRVGDFLEDLSHTSRVREDHLRTVYRYVYPDRMGLIKPEMLRSLTRHHRAAILAFLPTPDLPIPDFGNGIVNREEDDYIQAIPPPLIQHFQGFRYYDGEDYQRRLEAREERDGDEVSYTDVREQLYEPVANADLASVLQDLSQGITYGLEQHPELDEYSINLQRAVSVFMACHLVGVEVSRSDIARVHCVSELSLRECYTRVFRLRGELIDESAIQFIGAGNIGRVLSALPALNWPPL